MSGDRRIPLGEALLLARQVCSLIEHQVDRVQIAGSLRREKADVGDIEIVAAPLMVEKREGLFCDVALINALNLRVDQLLVWNEFAHRPDKNGRPANGGRFKRLLYRDFPLDLFIVQAPAQWGVILAIRTGPAEFSHRLVTPRRQGGLLPDYLKVKDGAIWHGDETLSTPEEADVFRVLGLPWIEPAARTGTERAAVAS